MNIFNSLTLYCDAPQPWGLYFQDSASPQMEALIELHDNIMFYLAIILFGVAWIMVSIIRNYVSNKAPISNKYLNHGTLIELIWTITPALILILIAFPSFKLLYLMDEVTDPSLTVFVEGNQWYWSYEYPNFSYDKYEVISLFSDKHAITYLLNDRDVSPIGQSATAASININLDSVPASDGKRISFDTNNTTINGESAYKSMSFRGRTRDGYSQDGNGNWIRSHSDARPTLVTLSTDYMQRHNIYLTYRGQPLLPISNMTSAPGYAKFELTA